MKQYDYIISGAGAAGLSLLMHMMQHQYFDDKSILVIDKVPKNENDRTWCFWETEPDLFEPVIYHSWQQMHFYSAYHSSLLHMQPYSYKMLRAIDFYNYVMRAAEKKTNITFKYATIEAVSNDVDTAGVIAEGVKYNADYVFNSIVFSKPDVPAGKYYLLQHFKGWMIKTTKPCFDPQKGTLMDFRVSQQQGTTFAYVLPVSPDMALVEYTLFTKKLLEPEAYDLQLKNYITGILKITDFSIEANEFGIIPMTNITFPVGLGRIVNIGSAGGQTKASSGYTFKFIQKQSALIVKELMRSGSPVVTSKLAGKRFKLYDSTLLNILHYNKMGGDQIFADLFKKNDVARVLRFLDNESSFEDEINIMDSVPKGIFLKAAFQEMFR